MSKVTAKFQVSIPRALADRVGIKVGDELVWKEVDGALVLERAAPAAALSVAERLAMYDAGTARQLNREKRSPRAAARERGWKRADLYTR